MKRLVRPVIAGAAAWACLIPASYAIFAESPADEPPRYCTVFNHFTKSGGSSLKRQLFQSCDRERSRLPGLITGVLRTTPAMRLNTVHNASVIMGYGEMLRKFNIFNFAKQEWYSDDFWMRHPVVQKRVLPESATSIGALWRNNQSLYRPFTTLSYYRRPLEAIGRDCEYFTMLRDPIERLVSAFYYCPTDHDVQDRPSKWCGDSKDEKEPLEDRLLEFATLEWSNRGFLMMMHSILCDPSFELCDPEHARETKFKPHNIDTREGWIVHNEIKGILATYTAVGIFEGGFWVPASGTLLRETVLNRTYEWELSMRLFNAKVKSPVRKWNANVAANPGNQSKSREALLRWAHTNTDIHSVLAADLLLYDYAVDLFRQQTRATLHVEWAP